MKSLIALSFAFLLMFAACSQDAPQTETTTKVTLEQLNTGDFEYVGGKVEVEGLCIHVCSHSGKKMFLSNNEGADRFMIYAGEGITGGFPKEIEGSIVAVIGTLEEEKLDLEYAEKLEAELAGEMEADSDHACDFEDDMKKIENLKERILASPKGYISKFTMNASEYKEIK